MVSGGVNHRLSNTSGLAPGSLAAYNTSHRENLGLELKFRSMPHVRFQRDSMSKQTFPSRPHGENLLKAGVAGPVMKKEGLRCGG